MAVGNSAMRQRETSRTAETISPDRTAMVRSPHAIGAAYLMKITVGRSTPTIAEAYGGDGQPGCTHGNFRRDYGGRRRARARQARGRSRPVAQIFIADGQYGRTRPLRHRRSRCGYDALHPERRHG